MNPYSNSVFCLLIRTLFEEKRIGSQLLIVRTGILPAIRNSTQCFTTPSSISRIKTETTEVVKENPII